MNIKQRRIQAGLRQEDLAKELHVDRTTVTKWESGAAAPRADKLAKLAKILRCTIDDLVAEGDERNEERAGA